MAIKMEMEEVCQLPGGYTLFRQKNSAGGYAYYSDEVGDGVFVWDTCLVSDSTLLAAIVEEQRRHLAELRAKRAHKA